MHIELVAGMLITWQEIVFDMAPHRHRITFIFREIDDVELPIRLSTIIVAQAEILPFLQNMFLSSRHRLPAYSPASFWPRTK